MTNPLAITLFTVFCQDQSIYINRSIVQEMKPIIVGSVIPQQEYTDFRGNSFPKDQLIIAYNGKTNKLSVAIKSGIGKCIYHIVDAENIIVKKSGHQPTGAE